MFKTSIPQTEHYNRAQTLLSQAMNDGYDGIVLFSHLNIHYIAGIFHLPSERPVVLGLTPDSCEMVIPRLERGRIESMDSMVENIHIYYDYPQGQPMKLVKEMCESLGIHTRTIAADSDGSPSIKGYSGPALSDVIPGRVGTVDYITDMRECKTQNEIEIIREASKWTHLGHNLLQEKISAGATPTVISSHVEAEATDILLSTLGDEYVMTGWENPISCLFLSGEVTEEPHNLDQTNSVSVGDNIISLVSATIGGYTTELERTLFVGEPSEEQRHYFEIMKESQEIAIDAMAPGVEYGYIERVVDQYYTEHKVEKYRQHHIGHSIGMEGHERPFLDKGYDGTIRSGEIFAVEPGFYIEDVGGFRHSDTVVVQDNNAERLTKYPTDIDSLLVQP
ncbi:M24 family metallopeptidase [Natrialbaceae archaeon A-CW1-1]